MGNNITQIIVVEGKTDTQKLQKVFGKTVKTVETKGLSLNAQTLRFLNDLNNTCGLVVLTDPDFPGQKIRQIINTKLDKPVLNAFIDRKDIKTKTKKIGVAEAEDTAIQRALSKLLKFSCQEQNSLSWDDYIVYQFYLKTNRVKITKKLGWSPTLNSKTLFKWLNWGRFTIRDIEKILKDNIDGN